MVRFSLHWSIISKIVCVEWQSRRQRTSQLYPDYCHSNCIRFKPTFSSEISFNLPLKWQDDAGAIRFRVLKREIHWTSGILGCIDPLQNSMALWNVGRMELASRNECTAKSIRNKSHWSPITIVEYTILIELIFGASSSLINYISTKNNLKITSFFVVAINWMNFAVRYYGSKFVWKWKWIEN